MRSIRVFCFLAFSVSVWAADPFLGTWKLNAAKSKFHPGAPPRSLTVTWSSAADGVKVQTEGVGADGRNFHADYVAIYDGKERAKPGPWSFDAVINRQVSDHEREDIFKKDGAVVGTTKLAVSADGAILIATWKYGEIRDVRVYEKR